MNRKPQVLDPKARELQINYWLTGATHDFESCIAIFNDAKRYGAALFFLHLSIEKILKALFVARNSQYAPMTHNLLQLAESCQLECDAIQEQKLATINEFNMVTRYPSQKYDFYTKATKEFSEAQIAEGREIFNWIELNLQKSPS